MPAAKPREAKEHNTAGSQPLAVTHGGRLAQFLDADRHPSRERFLDIGAQTYPNKSSEQGCGKRADPSELSFGRPVGTADPGNFLGA